MNHGTYINHKASETFLFNAIISFSAGLQDAYTYFFRNNVFANAQTGNVVLMGHYFMTGKIDEGIQYLAPLFSFAFGVVIAENICHLYKDSVKIHWRQIVLILEILVLFSVGFIPTEYNMLASSLVSLSCAMQLESFKTVHGFGYASTMCIGNLRSTMENLSKYIRNKDRNVLLKVYYYFGVIISFALGAGICGIFSKFMDLKTIWICCGVLLICCFLMIRKSSIFHIIDKEYYFKKDRKNNKERNINTQNNKNTTNKNVFVEVDINNNNNNNSSNNNNRNNEVFNRNNSMDEVEQDNDTFIQDIDDDEIIEVNYSSNQNMTRDNNQTDISIINIEMDEIPEEDKISIIHSVKDENTSKKNISLVHRTIDLSDEVALNDNCTIKNLNIDNTAPNYIKVQSLIINNSDCKSI